MCTPSATLDYNELARTIVKTSKDTGKTMLAALMGLAEGTENKQILSDGSIPHFMYAEPAIKTLNAMYSYRDWLGSPRAKFREFKVEKQRVKAILDNIAQQGRKNVLEEEGYEVLASYGFSTPKSFLGTTEEECTKAARDEIGYPVVMKIVSPDIIHKSDAGGVKVGLKNDNEIRAAFKDIMNNAKSYKSDAQIKGILVQEMITSAKEIILGAKQDPLFGPLIMVGLGGIYVEILKDVVFRLAPIDEHEAEKMVESIRAIKLLKGIRGETPSDLAAVVDSLQRLSQLITDFPEIEEFDINPLLVLERGKGARVADIRIGLKKRT
jgi:4-hydroxybutyrate---CoA ligase (ADP-forming)